MGNGCWLKGTGGNSFANEKAGLAPRFLCLPTILNQGISEQVLCKVNIPSGAKAQFYWGSFAARDPEGAPVVPFQNIDG
jgi:hypothetical protein